MREKEREKERERDGACRGSTLEMTRRVKEANEPKAVNLKCQFTLLVRIWALIVHSYVTGLTRDRDTAIRSRGIWFVVTFQIAGKAKGHEAK